MGFHRAGSLRDKLFRDKICVYDEHPITGQDIQYRAPDSRSRYTTPLDEIILNIFLLRHKFEVCGSHLLCD